MYDILRKRMTAVGLEQPVQEFILDEMTAPHRHYHTVHHLALMLKSIDRAYSSNLIRDEDAVSVVVATLFHDVVYDPKASDNEEQSVVEAKLRLNSRRYNLRLIESLIMATKGHDMAKYRERTDPHYWMVYADLSILWAKPQTYAWYARGVRAEYAFVPAELYRKGRADVITKLTKDLVRTFSGDYCWTLGSDPVPSLKANHEWELEQLARGTFDAV